jgi:hypothetical protein
MAESKVLQIGDSKRPESLQKNLYKIDSPYDLTDDVVTKSLNLLQSITGYDYRSNSVVDIVERLIDSQNSELVKIGGERLLVEFGRRAGNNILGKFIPSPTNFIGDLKKIIKGEFKKADASITDLSKDSSRTFFDKVLQTGIGYRSNENFLDKEYGKLDNTKTSDINFTFSGDMIKEKIQQLNKKSVFSTYNTQSSKVEFAIQSLVFRNTYNEKFTSNFETTNNLTETFTKSYFQPYEKEESKLIKNYDLEKKNIEKEQGFGRLGKMDGYRTDRTTLSIPEVLSVENINTYVYDTDVTKQNDINTKFGVRRGLVYFTSKLVKENPTISHNQKLIKNDNDVNPNIAYYKGNGECRTFTIYDQYDNYDRVIKFNGNNEKNSVLRDKVLPRIAPTVDDIAEDRYNYFFTMENLALKDSVDDCEIGPNGGRWMWFPPYDVKISDNNSINWSDMNFLGRPEPIFSYQNTTRSLSLSFRLLIDTVKEIQDIEPTIQNYYNYLYQCGQLAFKEKNEKKEIVVTSETPTKITSKTTFRRDDKSIYCFKNEGYVVNTTTPVYSLGGELESASTINSGFVTEFTDIVNFLKQYMLEPNCTSIDMSFEGAASSLISLTASTEFAKNYNRALGLRRADNLMRNVIYKYNQIRGDAPELVITQFIAKSGPNITDSTTVGGLVVNTVVIDTGQVGINATRTYYQTINGKTISITIATVGADSNPNPVDKSDPNETKVNDKNKISQRYAKVESIVAKVDIIQEDRKINTEKQIVDVPIPLDEAAQKPEPCDTNKNLEFESLEVYNKFPTGFEKLNVFTPTFNSQTPFDFTKRYVFLHQLTRPSKLNTGKNNLATIDNTVFGRMPVFVIRYGDFIYSKAIARSINFDITDSTWDLNPEGMGAIPLYCNVTMDLTLIGGQSLAGPIDRIQTANDSNFIANSTFNTGYYAGNKTFEKARKQEEIQWKDRASGSKPNPRTRPSNGNKPQDANLQGIPRVEQRPTITPIKEPAPDLSKSFQFQRQKLADIPETIDADAALRFIQEQNAAFEKGL